MVEASLSDGLMSYPGHLFGMSYSSAEIQSMSSTAPADWARIISVLCGVCMQRKNKYTKQKNNVICRNTMTVVVVVGG